MTSPLCSTPADFPADTSYKPQVHCECIFCVATRHIRTTKSARKILATRRPQSAARLAQMSANLTISVGTPTCQFPWRQRRWACAPNLIGKVLHQRRTSQWSEGFEGVSAMISIGTECIRNCHFSIDHVYLKWGSTQKTSSHDFSLPQLHEQRAES
jgi:hypothetical protein